jgi:AcrR family transcriptional regulator
MSIARSTNDGRRAWDGNPPHAAAARQRLLEAASRCIAREGIAATSVAAVAAEAGVSRQTVYRYFEGRDQLVLRSVRVAAEALRAKLDRTIRALSDPADMMVEAVLLGVAEVRTDPVLRAVADPSRLDGSVLARITGREGIAWARESFAPAFEAAGWSEADADAGLELILRIFLSLIISPSPERSPEALRAFLYRHLVPGLGLAAGEEM